MHDEQNQPTAGDDTQPTQTPAEGEDTEPTTPDDTGTTAGDGDVAPDKEEPEEDNTNKGW